MIPSVDSGWGGMTENGSWNGMVGMVERGEVEIAVSDFYMTPSRKDVVDFTVALLEDE